MQWSPTMVKSAKLDHTRPVKDMSSTDLMLEFAFLLSGEADEKDERKGVRLGLGPVLYQRLQEVASRLKGFESDLRHLKRCNVLDGVES